MAQLSFGANNTLLLRAEFRGGSYAIPRSRGPLYAATHPSRIEDELGTSCCACPTDGSCGGPNLSTAQYH